MKYRSRIDIAAAILDAATEGALITEIMHKAFLSFLQLQQYLELLESNGLIAYSEETTKYLTTDTGKHFLIKYSGVCQMLYSSDNKPLLT